MEFTREILEEVIGAFGRSIEKRFDQIDKRLDAIEGRLDAVEERLDAVE